MILCYIDESGTPDIPGNSSHFILAGLAIPIESWKNCDLEVEKIKRNYFLTDAEIHTAWILRPYLEQSKIPNFERLSYADRKYEVTKYRTTELLRLQASPHAQKQYFNTKKNFSKTNAYIHLTWDERKRFIKEIATLVGNWGTFCRLFAECIDKVHFNPAKAHKNISEQSFEQIVSRFEQYLQIFSKTKSNHVYGILIHDNNETVSKKHTEIMKEFHKKGTFWTDINNIIETPLFVNSELTSMIQLADVCSYSIRRYLEKGETVLFNEVFKVADKKSSKVVGVRHFSSTTCGCIICKSHR